MLVVRTKNAITIVSTPQRPHLRIILRIYSCPAEILMGFDIDSCSCGCTFIHAALRCAVPQSSLALLGSSCRPSLQPPPTSAHRSRILSLVFMLMARAAACTPRRSYDGESVFALPRARRALTRHANVVDLGRMSTTYEVRLAKYAKRGFAVAIPGACCGARRRSLFRPLSFPPFLAAHVQSSSE